MKVVDMTNGRKKALVTGGSSGIGFGIAEALIEADYLVTLIGRNEARLLEAVKSLGPSASWRRADVGRHEEIRAALAGPPRANVT